jgi:hypothetical protein
MDPLVLLCSLESPLTMTTCFAQRPAYRAFRAGSGQLRFRHWILAHHRYHQLDIDYDLALKADRPIQHAFPWRDVENQVACLELLLCEDGDTIAFSDEDREGLLDAVVRPYDPALADDKPPDR